MNHDELKELPATISVTEAAQIVGIGRCLAYELIRSGEWPTPVLRLGRLIRVPTAPLLAFVLLADTDSVHNRLGVDGRLGAEALSMGQEVTSA